MSRVSGTSCCFGEGYQAGVAWTEGVGWTLGVSVSHTSLCAGTNLPLVAGPLCLTSLPQTARLSPRSLLIMPFMSSVRLCACLGPPLVTSPSCLSFRPSCLPARPPTMPRSPTHLAHHALHVVGQLVRLHKPAPRLQPVLKLRLDNRETGLALKGGVWGEGRVMRRDGEHRRVGTGGHPSCGGGRGQSSCTQVAQPTGARPSPSLSLLPACLPRTTVHAPNVLGSTHDSSVLKPRKRLGIT